MKFQDVDLRVEKEEEVFFTKDSACLKELVELMSVQNHRTMVLWALECGRVPLELLEDRYPDEKRPGRAFDLCEQWAQGETGAPEARKAICDCLEVCEEMDDEYGIALCHAIAEALETVGDQSHAIGLAIYELTALVLQDRENYRDRVERRIGRYVDTLKYFRENADKINKYRWADFLMEDVK